MAEHNVCRRSASTVRSPQASRDRLTSAPEVFMRTRVSPSPISFLVAALLALLVDGPAHVASAQTSMVPYFGKNNVHYDRFDWHIYTTDHFEIYYYPEIEKHLERLASYAESAYQQISADLKHDLSF